jgi:hypothetical protein
VLFTRGIALSAAVFLDETGSAAGFLRGIGAVGLTNTSTSPFDGLDRFPRWVTSTSAHCAMRESPAISTGIRALNNCDIRHDRPTRSSMRFSAMSRTPEIYFNAA